MSEKLLELNRARIAAKAHADMLRCFNVATAPIDELTALDAQYQLAMDAWSRAETEYRAELQSTPTGALMALAGVSAPGKSPRRE